MNKLTEAINDYLIMRSNMGYKLVQVKVWLKQFADFMNTQNASWVTTKLSLEWAMQPTGGQPEYWSKRLNAVRCFARYQKAIDPRTEIPDQGILPNHLKRAKPYLYSEEEIVNLLAATMTLQSRKGLRRLTYYCLFGLLAVTGMRIGEALSLKRQDVDLQQRLLTIRGAKFGKSRLIPIHPSTIKVLGKYAKLRDEIIGSSQCTDKFLVSEHGWKALHTTTVHSTFNKLFHQTGLCGLNGNKCPRIHDLRHRFATETLLRWYRSGEDVERLMPVLSTYLGHSRTSGTFWYISACPELLGEAARMLEKRWGAPS